MCVYMKGLIMGLIHMTTDAEKFQNNLSMIWKARTSSSVAQSNKPGGHVAVMVQI